MGCHLGVGLRLGATACSGGGYTAAGARGEFLYGSSRKHPHNTSCPSHMAISGCNRSAEDIPPPPVLLSTPCAVALSVQHPRAAKPGWHVFPAMLLAAQGRGERDAPRGSQLLVWAVGHAGRMISWLCWDSPEMQGAGLASLPFFFFSHCFHPRLGGRRAKPEDAPSSPAPMTPAPQMSQGRLGFALRKVIWYKISRTKFLLLIKAPFK